MARRDDPKDHRPVTARGFFSSWGFGEPDNAESDRRVRGKLWAENTGTRAQRAKAVRARARGR